MQILSYVFFHDVVTTGTIVGAVILLLGNLSTANDAGTFGSSLQFVQVVLCIHWRRSTSRSASAYSTKPCRLTIRKHPARVVLLHRPALERLTVCRLP